MPKKEVLPLPGFSRLMERWCFPWSVPSTTREGLSVAPAQRSTGSLGREGLDAPESGGHEGPGIHMGPTLTPAEPSREWWILTGGLRTCRPARPRLWHPWDVPVAAVDHGADPGPPAWRGAGAVGQGRAAGPPRGLLGAGPPGTAGAPRGSTAASPWGRHTTAVAPRCR